MTHHSKSQPQSHKTLFWHEATTRVLFCLLTSLVHSHFYVKASIRCVLIVSLVFEICSKFSLRHFSKPGFKRSLNTRKLFKATLLNENQDNLEKEMYGKISLYLFIISLMFIAILLLDRKNILCILSSWIKKLNIK